MYSQTLFGNQAAQHPADTATAVNKPTVSELVEYLGGGLAQIVVLLLGPGGVFFIEGMLLTGLNIITTSAAADMNVADSARGLLTTLAFVGLCIGVAIGGSMADVWGRRRCVLASFFISGISTALAATLAHSWLVMGLCSGGIGFGSGVGVPPSIAMLSEMSPQSWRIPLRAATSACFIPAACYFAILAGLDNPMLQGLMWRNLLLYSLIPICAIGALATIFLPESPVFQAAKGEHSGAIQGFRWVSRLNGQVEGPCVIDYHVPEEGTLPTNDLGFKQKLGVIFSSKYCFTTIAATFACFCMNLTQYGCMYASPQIFQQSSSLAPAWQMMVTMLPALPVLGLGGFFLNQVDRKSAVISGLCFCCVGLFCTCSSGVHTPPRPFLLEALYQVGAISIAGGAGIGFTVIFQLSVEIFPTVIAGTGSAVVIGVGRLGAIIAPELFEYIQGKFHWTAFYYLIAILSAMSMVLLSLAPSAESLSECASDVEVRKKEAKSEAGYGSIENQKTV